MPRTIESFTLVDAKRMIAAAETLPTHSGFRTTSPSSMPVAI